MGRLKNSAYNSISNILVNISTTIFSFVVRTVFINQLGEQLLGLDGLFTNILSLLSLTELGFSTAISFSLYKPLATNDSHKVNQLIIYFKEIYRRVAIIILVIGLLLLPFLGYIAKDYTVGDNIYILYLLYLINTASTYFISYSTILMEADQKNYKLTKIRLLFDFMTSLFQLLILYLFSSFILYLIIQFVIRLIQRVITHLFIKKHYKDIDFNNCDSITNLEKKEIKKNIKGLIFHRVGNYAINGTDNILISSIINISMTGIYSNYLSLISIFKSLISTIISAMTASLGNLNATENYVTKKRIFELINFICYFIVGFISVGIYFCINDFIVLWIGEKYLLSNPCVIIICLNFYLSCILLPIDAMKNTSGLYYVDRYVSIIQAVINLLCSIILGIYFGISGILLGTTISYILTVSITKPYIIYKHIFGCKCIEYYYSILKNIIVMLITVWICSSFEKTFVIYPIIYRILFLGIISTIVYILLFIMVNFSTYEFKYYVVTSKNIIKKLIRKRGK